MPETQFVTDAHTHVHGRTDGQSDLNMPPEFPSRALKKQHFLSFIFMNHKYSKI